MSLTSPVSVEEVEGGRLQPLGRSRRYTFEEREEGRTNHRTVTTSHLRLPESGSVLRLPGSLTPKGKWIGVLSGLEGCTEIH